MSNKNRTVNNPAKTGSGRSSQRTPTVLGIASNPFPYKSQYQNSINDRLPNLTHDGSTDVGGIDPIITSGDNQLVMFEPSQISRQDQTQEIMLKVASGGLSNPNQELVQDIQQ